MFNSYLSAVFHPEYSGVQLRFGVVQRTASPDRSDLALELTFGNPQHLSSYAMDMLDVGRHLCASTWVRMVIIAPRELGQERGELGLLFLAKQSKPLISKRTTRR